MSFTKPEWSGAPATAWRAACDVWKTWSAAAVGMTASAEAATSAAAVQSALTDIPTSCSNAVVVRRVYGARAATAARAARRDQDERRLRRTRRTCHAYDGSPTIRNRNTKLAQADG